jgi:hypothetical protein
MRNFLKIVVTSVLRLNLFLKDSIATAARLLRSTQPSVQRTSKGVSYGSTKMRHLTTATGLRAMSGGRVLILDDVDYQPVNTDALFAAYSTIEPLDESLLSKNEGATTSSSEKETI